MLLSLHRLRSSQVTLACFFLARQCKGGGINQRLKPCLNEYTPIKQSVLISISTVLLITFMGCPSSKWIDFLTSLRTRNFESLSITYYFQKYSCGSNINIALFINLNSYSQKKFKNTFSLPITVLNITLNMLYAA